jgi:hypothetical protein
MQGCGERSSAYARSLACGNDGRTAKLVLSDRVAFPPLCSSSPLVSLVPCIGLMPIYDHSVRRWTAPETFSVTDSTAHILLMHSPYPRMSHMVTEADGSTYRPSPPTNPILSPRPPSVVMRLSNTVSLLTSIPDADNFSALIERQVTAL